MDLDAVRTFVAVTEAGQFSEAAADLSLTQQAVSKRVAALEKDLGVRLLTRTARGVQLTANGNRSCRMPVSCCRLRDGPPPRCGPAAAPCVST